MLRRPIIYFFYILSLLYYIYCDQSSYSQCTVDQKYTSCQSVSNLLYCPTIDDCLTSLQSNSGEIIVSQDVIQESTIDINTDSPFNLIIKSENTDATVRVYCEKGFLSVNSSSQLTLTLQNITLIGSDSSDVAVTLISRSSSSQLELSSVSISKFNGMQNGAALYTDSVQVMISQSSITENKAVSGAALYIADETSKLVISQSKFLNNTSNYQGGAIYANYIDVSDSIFQYNRGGEGGAIYCTLALVESTQFLENYAEFSGGAIQVDIQSTSSQCYSNINNCTFNDNTASLYGGHLSVASGLHVISQSLLTSGSAQEGGAISLTQLNFSTPTSFNLTGSIFSKNSAAVGSGFSSSFIVPIQGGQFSQPQNSKSFPLFFYDNNTALVLSPEDCPTLPLISDSSLSSYYVCLGVNGTCVNGYGVVNSSGSLVQCNCFYGYYGSFCNNISNGNNDDNSQM